MTKDEILEIKICDMSIKEWLSYFNCYSVHGLIHYNIFEGNGHIQIKVKLTKGEVYSEIFYGHYSDFEVFINAMKFFRQMFKQH